MHASPQNERRLWLSDLAWAGAATGITGAARPLQAVIAQPAWLYCGALAVMLFRPPDLQCFPFDRVAFALLVGAALLRALALRQPLRIVGSISVPMLALGALALADLLTRPYDAQAWSVFAAKWAVPFTLFHLAGLVLEDETSIRIFETFCLIVLGYLSFTSIAFATGAHSLIFPRYILDESLGIHADRARGPFLQAVANGVSLTLLGLIALDSLRRARLRGITAAVLLAALPLAILATMTRAVWLSFALSIVALIWLSRSRQVRRACMGLVAAGVLAIGAIWALGSSNAVEDRFEDRSPVEFRRAVYEAGWGMFLEKPFWGWGTGPMQSELDLRVSGFRQEAFYLHNSYLEILVSRGVIGLALYLWILWGLWRLRKRPRRVEAKTHFMDGEFRRIWPVLIGVYALNACFVVMNYQFVNALFYTIAGVLAAQTRRAEIA